MTKAIAQTYTATAHYRIYMTAALCAGCLLAVMFYSLNLYHVISRTVALQRLNTQATALTSTVDSLDSQYLALSSAATVGSLSAYGLQAGQVAAYIPLSASTASLSILAAGGHEF